MKLSIQGTPIENSDMPYARQMKSLLENGPVAIIKSDAGVDITFFGAEDADLLLYFSITNSTWDTVEQGEECECSHCTGYNCTTHTMNFEDKDGFCESEEHVFKSANFQELTRMPSDGSSFVNIAQSLKDYFGDYCEVDFIIGMKSELSNDIIGYPLSGSLVREKTENGIETKDDLNWAAK